MSVHLSSSFNDLPRETAPDIQRTTKVQNSKIQFSRLQTEMRAWVASTRAVVVVSALMGFCKDQKKLRQRNVFYPIYEPFYVCHISLQIRKKGTS